MKRIVDVLCIDLNVDTAILLLMVAILLCMISMQFGSEVCLEFSKRIAVFVVSMTVYKACMSIKESPSYKGCSDEDEVYM